MSLLADLESRICPSCWSDLRVVACDECGDTFCRACLEGGVCAVVFGWAFGEWVLTNNGWEP